MPRKSTAKRVYKKKTLRKGNIFKNKSAKSQAKQIYALNKKVNRVYKNLAPEIITKQCKFLNTYTTTDGSQTAYGRVEMHGAFYLYEGTLLNPDKINYQMVGELLRVRNFTIYGQFGYDKTYSPPSTKSQGDETQLVDNVPKVAYLRLILCKLKGGNQGRYPTQITKTFDSTITNDYGLINGPLVDDITAGLKVVRNRVIKITNNNENKMFRICVKYPGIYRKSPYVGTSIPAFKNEYLLYWQYYCPISLEYGGSQPTATLGPICNISMAIKYAFTDN